VEIGDILLSVDGKVMESEEQLQEFFNRVRHPKDEQRIQVKLLSPGIKRASQPLVALFILIVIFCTICYYIVNPLPFTGKDEL
jgi:hypothetical protein